MKSATINRIASAVGLSLLVTACAGFPEAYPPPANPFISGATPLQNSTLAQPAKFGLVSLVGLDLASGKSLFFVVANGEARLLATNYEDARPFYPTITPGRTGNFIYPDAATFPPGAVQSVALEDAVNGLIYELGKALGI